MLCLWLKQNKTLHRYEYFFSGTHQKLLWNTEIWNSQFSSFKVFLIFLFLFLNKTKPEPQVCSGHWKCQIQLFTKWEIPSIKKKKSGHQSQNLKHKITLYPELLPDIFKHSKYTLLPDNCMHCNSTHIIFSCKKCLTVFFFG